LRTHQVPAMLTSASPGHTFSNMSQQPYEWFAENRHADVEKWFTITCWFYWPLPKADAKQRVLVHSTPSEDGQDGGRPLIAVDVDVDKEGRQVSRWTLSAKETVNGTTRWKQAATRLTTPDLNPGWHMVSVLSSTENNDEDGCKFNGTMFYLDEWKCPLIENTWIPNDFHTVGNSPSHKTPFGLITDFRIYSRVLNEQALKQMVRSRDTDLHPDRLTRMLAERDAASILALRLDVPDSAAECLRALGSLATLASQRAKIFSVCGRRILQLIDSPLPMVQRQAARLISNIT